MNKLGVNCYFTTDKDDYIDFSKMLKSCSHELTHYLRFIKHGKSSCESDLMLDNRKYDAELAQEHKEWRDDIYRLIEEDFSNLEQKWKEI
ncbi:MAG: hypothetical protein MRERC_4c026 [Mycoplasmataceae bacterium RC_NB112A]|nr:MAG: hypothetical protein MRERC_4c026 [Mycoplasmataceae bacterium RC_NB112A]